MGKVEKIVVLGVVFVIVVILAVSLQTGGGDDVRAKEKGGDPDRDVARVDLGDGVAAASDGIVGLEDDGSGRLSERLEPAPRTGHESALVDEPGALERLQEPSHATGFDPATIEESIRSAGDPSTGDRTSRGQRSPLLSAESLPDRPIYEVPEDIPEDWDLQTLGGLADHLFDPSLKVYTAREGDTFASLALRYYGDEAFVSALERNNEGVDAPTAGHQLLLPVRAAAILAEPASEYVVKPDDSLWKIAKEVYGEGHRWGEIYEANRDVLRTPDAVTPGTTLRIP